MVLKSVHMQLRTAEVPIRFLKDREGRLSHHKRAGWFSPWQAAGSTCARCSSTARTSSCSSPDSCSWRSGSC